MVLIDILFRNGFGRSVVTIVAPDEDIDGGLWMAYVGTDDEVKMKQTPNLWCH